MKPYQKVHAYWGADAEASPPVPETRISEIASLEARWGIRFPADFRDYLLRACPGAGFELWDDDDTTWWSMDRLKLIDEEYDQPLSAPDLDKERGSAVFFADYMIWCLAWAVCCGPGPNYGRVLVVSGADRFVADDFAGFVDQYLINSGELF
ncbi:MAG: Cell wall assembly/cell proliferation coordinating protein [Mucilaginibacter sp.]|nr:Cell wall assembly/cell proliferation coordinating protein [Mucilaginibacter sp.]